MWSRLISLNNLVKLKLKKIHIQHCVFHAPLLLRKRCSPVPKFPLPCYLNCSNFFTTPICHCTSWTHIPVHSAYFGLLYISTEVLTGVEGATSLYSTSATFFTKICVFYRTELQTIVSISEERQKM